MSTTPAGVTEGFKNTTESTFQSLFDSGALNEGPTDPGRFEREEKPRATQPNPAEIEAAKQVDKPEVEALQPEQPQRSKQKPLKSRNIRAWMSISPKPNSTLKPSRPFPSRLRSMVRQAKSRSPMLSRHSSLSSMFRRNLTP